MIIKLVVWMTCAANLLALGYGEICPTECTCEINKVDCSHQDLIEFPSPISSNATVLNLVGNKIQEMDRSTLNKLLTVQQLCLQSNSITKLNSEIFKMMTNMLRLDLSYNQISEIHKRAFTGLSQLSGLILNGNKIENLNGAFSRTHELTSLNLADNRLTGINQDEFAKLTKLKYLDLGGNLITTIHPKAFENLKELRYLILQDNKITALDVMSFSTRSLSVVDFTKNSLVRMPRGLPRSVMDFRGGNNKIGAIEKDDLSNMTSLQLLTLNDNSIAHIHDDAFKSNRNLKELWLTSNKLTSLPKSLPSGLIKLFVNTNKIRKIEKDAFDGNRHLEYLTLQMNELTEISSRALSQLKGLTYLNVQGNHLTRLARDVFVGMPSLQILALANNPIASVEAKAFDNLVSLTKLDMSYNEQKDIKIYMDIFKAMPKLKELNLMNSPGLALSLLDQISILKISPTESVEIIDLQYNNLLNLPQDFRTTFPNVTMLKLTHNAWHCDKNLIWLKKYLETPKIRFAENLDNRPVCCTPLKLKGKAITEVADTDFELSPSDGNGRVIHDNEERTRLEETKNQLIAEGEEEDDSEKVNLSLVGVEVDAKGDTEKEEEEKGEDANVPKSRKKRRKGSRKGKKSKKDRKKRKASKKRRRRRDVEDAE